MAGLNVSIVPRMVHQNVPLRTVVVPSAAITARTGTMISVVEQVNGNSLTNEAEISALQGKPLSLLVTNRQREQISAAWVVGKSEAAIRAMGFQAELFLAPGDPLKFDNPLHYDAIRAIGGKTAEEIDHFLDECRSFGEISCLSSISTLVKQLGIDLIPIQAGKFIFQGGSGVGHHAFEMARTPFTNGQFKKLLELAPDALSRIVSGPQARLEKSLGISIETVEKKKLDSPMVYLNWREAKGIAELLGLRLPTELEWERAATYTDGRIYPFGSKFDEGKVAFRERGTRSVFSHPDGASPKPEGILDLSGNVWEWMASTPFLDTVYLQFNMC